MTAYRELELSELGTRDFGRALRFYPSTDSTNQRMLEWAAEGASHGASCLADAQTAGRGRQGRTWTSEPGQGLYASLLLRPQRSLAGVASFSLVTALAVAESLGQLGLRGVQLKWPNDLWWQGRKLAGLLLEARGGARPVIVVGLGLNLRPPAAGWSEALRDQVISLEEGGFAAPSPASLWAAVLNALEPRWELYTVEGFPAFQQEWRANDLLMGREVAIQEGERWSRAWVDGVDPRGRLLVRGSGEEARALDAGEVHLDLGFRP